MPLDPVTAAFEFLTGLTVHVFPVIIRMIEERKVVPDTALQIAVKIVKGINKDHGPFGEAPFPPAMRRELAFGAIMIDMWNHGMEPNDSDVNWFMEQAVKIINQDVLGEDVKMSRPKTDTRIFSKLTDIEHELKALRCQEAINQSKLEEIISLLKLLSCPNTNGAVSLNIPVGEARDQTS